jgi:very-short-patch-repair endonuclease
VVDFVCHSARLIIEVDGSHHGYDRQAQVDADRTQWLASHGYRVLRFWNREVLTDIEVVLDTVFAALYTPCSTGTAADTQTRSPCPQGGRAK